MKEAELFPETSVAVFNSSHIHVQEDVNFHIIILFLSLVRLLEQALKEVLRITHTQPYVLHGGQVAIPVIKACGSMS